ncbi:hypothetical protein PAHAL_1G430900 [Panicum hallii]|uniref:Uncharacterized protein n=1 Tax=Panicum hallii TaxID=206008 RepID=A0A2T8KY61_9POAL|nr:hypothetical protein PAHAL_1G430900 [Panicum hallii]PVH67116.1 hypothetical protein PAHAL_1G430900 [Panicum hallii]PVH67117.1 hypothetical protein PAHAL_1G430900 [Panicum hallii]
MSRWIVLGRLQIEYATCKSLARLHMPSTRRRLPDFEFPIAPRVAATRLALPCATPPSAPTRVPVVIEQIRVGRCGSGADGELETAKAEAGGMGALSVDSATTGSGVVTSGAATLIWIPEN